MKRIGVLLMFGLMLSSCNNISSSNSSFSNLSEISRENDVVSKVERLSDSKTCLIVDGKPFNLRGAQVRIDGLMNRLSTLEDAPKPLSFEEMEVYFAKAKEIGLNTLELPVEWSKIETSKDVYNFDLVDALLTMCNKYDLKCEFLWFSTNMCGDVHEFHVPSYILNDEESYPKISADKLYKDNKLYGDFYFLVLNNPKLMQREEKVLSQIMNHVYEWNQNNGNKNPLIGFQVHNEPDGLLRWRLKQNNLKLNVKSVEPMYLWKMILESLNNAGMAIKKSNYKIYTRVNMTVTLGVDNFKEFPDLNMSPLDVMDLEGIDIVGDDPYVDSPSIINQVVKRYNVKNNYPMICENMGNYSSSPSLFLTAYQAGGCYMFYDLATSEYFIYANKGSSYQMDQGLLNYDLTYKSHSEDTINIIKSIKDMECIVPLTDSKDFACFNVKTISPLTSISQTINTSNISLTFKTNDGAIGCAIEHGEYVYMFANKKSKMIINNADIRLKIDIGVFKDEEYVVKEEQYITNEIDLTPNKLYRVSIRKIHDKVVSTTNEYV